jgi:outer membrane protein assembly factor BamE (lipoprotein component of BamABCDE complex)
MPIKTVCPECDRAYTLADTMEGKSVKCKGCGQTFTVEAVANGATGVAARPSNSKVKAVRPADDDDEAEAPKGGGMGKVLLIGGALVAVLALFVCGGVGIGGFWLWHRASAPSDSQTTSNTNSDKPNTDKNDGQAPPGGTKKLTLENYNKIQGGMTRAQVEAILGPPTADLGGVGKTTIHSWVYIPDQLTITYYDGRVKEWGGVINNQILSKSDPSIGNPTDPKPDTKVTKANLDKIKGGMTDIDLIGLLGLPTNNSAPIDPVARQYIGDKGRLMVWKNGQDYINVGLNPDGKVACWMGQFNNLAMGYFSDQAFVVKPTDPNPTTKVTKDNFNKIKGGMSEFDVAQILGRPTNPNAQADPDTANYDKAHTQVWQNGADSITVTFCNKKAARWVGMIGGEKVGPTIDQASVVLKNNSPVTKANYDKIVKGTPEALLLQTFGPPASKSPEAKHAANKMTGVPAHTTYHCQWTDGQGGNMTIHFINFGMGGMVDRKEEFRLK